MDPILLLARQRIVKASADLEVQLASLKGGGPCVEILRRLKDKAAESLCAIPFINIDEPKGIVEYKTLANEVKRYDEWIEHMRAIVHEGIEYDKEFTAGDRAEMFDLLMKTEEGRRTAVALGLIDETPGDV